MNQPAVEKQFRQKLLDVNDLLANLDITVGFLVSVGGDPNTSLVQFMTETLKMKTKTNRQLFTDAVSVSRRFMFVMCLEALLSVICLKEFHVCHVSRGVSCLSCVSRRYCLSYVSRSFMSVMCLEAFHVCHVCRGVSCLSCVSRRFMSVMCLEAFHVCHVS